MAQLIISFLVLMNPFALFVYLLPLKRELGLSSFIQILLRASLISFIIYVLFALFGQQIFSTLLKIDFDSFRIFGGIVVASFALSFILQGKKSLITTRGELSSIAAEVALPFMVGAATITLSILIGRSLSVINAIATIGAAMSINAIIIVLLALFRQTLKNRMLEVFDKNMDIVLRVNGFFVGAIGVDLIITGIRGLTG
ncbi:MAG: MarC family protein [Candidatus Saccharimonadales bacterium]